MNLGLTTPPPFFLSFGGVSVIGWIELCPLNGHLPMWEGFGLDWVGGMGGVRVPRMACYQGTRIHLRAGGGGLDGGVGGGS